MTRLPAHQINEPMSEEIEMSNITGSCQCGAIQYRSEQSHPIGPGSVDGENDCCPAEAAVFAMVAVSADSLGLRGLTPSVFEYRALDGDIALRSFCPQCGTTLFAEYESAPNMIYVRTMTPANSLAIDHVSDAAVRYRPGRPQSGSRRASISNVLPLPRVRVS